MSKTGKISYSKIWKKKDSATKKEFHREFVFGDNTFDVVIKPYIPASEWAEVIESAVNSLFDGSGANAEYKPFFKTFVLHYALVTAMTNVELPDDPSAAWDFLNTTGLGDFVFNAIEEIDRKILNEFVFGYEGLIKYRLSANTRSGRLDKLVDKGAEILDEFAEKIRGADDIDALIRFAKELAANAVGKSNDGDVPEFLSKDIVL